MTRRLLCVMALLAYSAFAHADACVIRLAYNETLAPAYRFGDADKTPTQPLSRWTWQQPNWAAKWYGSASCSSASSASWNTTPQTPRWPYRKARKARRFPLVP